MVEGLLNLPPRLHGSQGWRAPSGAAIGGAGPRAVGLMPAQDVRLRQDQQIRRRGGEPSPGRCSGSGCFLGLQPRRPSSRNLRRLLKLPPPPLRPFCKASLDTSTTPHAVSLGTRTGEPAAASPHPPMCPAATRLDRYMHSSHGEQPSSDDRFPWPPAAAPGAPSKKARSARQEAVYVLGRRLQRDSRTQTRSLLYRPLTSLSGCSGCS